MTLELKVCYNFLSFICILNIHSIMPIYIGSHSLRISSCLFAYIFTRTCFILSVHFCFQLCTLRLFLQCLHTCSRPSAPIHARLHLSVLICTHPILVGTIHTCSHPSTLSYARLDLFTPTCTHSFDTHYHWYVFVFTRLHSFILIHICSYLHRFNLCRTRLSSLV